MPKKWLPEDEYIPKSLKKRTIEQSVHAMALERIERAYKEFDHIQVSFSGGKDSTVVLNLCLEVAERIGRLPLDVVFWDEEAIHPPTIDYCARVAQDPRIAFRWYCLPVKHTNACSVRAPWWYPWAPEDEALWCRPMPEGALTFLEHFQRAPIPEMHFLTVNPKQGVTAVMVGIRADESLTRYRGVAKREHDNYITWHETPRFPGHTHAYVKPIYDWTTPDVWLAPHQFGWDYNRTYDLFELYGLPRNEQRVAPPYGEQPLRNLMLYQACFPELWDKMCQRVPGAATAARYSQGELYSYGKMHLPAGYTWREMVEVFLRRHTLANQKFVAHRIKQEIDQHVRYSNNAPIHDTEGHPLTGISWKWLAKLAHKGDFKHRLFPKRNPALNAEMPLQIPEGELHEV